MLCQLPPPSGDAATRSSAPSVPGREVAGTTAGTPPVPTPAAGPHIDEREGGGAGVGAGGGDEWVAGNLLDDLRERWLEMEGAELEERDASAAEFDRRLEQLAALGREEEELLGDGEGEGGGEGEVRIV